MSTLARLRVLDLAPGRAGGYCTKLLADAGAAVTRAVPGPGADRDPAAGSPLAHYLAKGKVAVTADPSVPAGIDTVIDLATGSDVIVTSEGSPYVDVDRLHPLALRSAFPAATIVSITSFGLEGPWAGRPATEFTLQAWVGGITHRGSPDAPPVAVGGRVGEWLAGAAAADDVLAWGGLDAGVLLDVSILETLALTHTGMNSVTRWSMSGEPWKPHRNVHLPGVEPALDGWVGFMLVTGQQWLDFCVLVGRPDWMDDLSLVRSANRLAREDEIRPAIRSWTAERTVEEILTIADALRIPAAPVCDAAGTTALDHLLDRRSLRPDPETGALEPAVPYRVSGGDRAGAANATPEPTGRAPRGPVPTGAPGPSGTHLPYAGLRVLEFTAFWAGPLVGQRLGALGADVIHVESARHPDGARSLTVRPQDPLWHEWSGEFNGINTDKRGIAVDIGSPEGKATIRRLIRHCDVVVDNFAPRVLESWDLGYESLRALRDDIVMLRMPAFGLDGAWRDKVGFAQTMEQLSGLAWITGHPDREPVVPNGLCDPNAGFHALFALQLALRDRARTGQGALVEAAMIDATLNIAAEAILEWTVNGCRMARIGNRSPDWAPQGLYRASAGDAAEAWVAISVVSDEQWRRLAELLGVPEWGADDRFATVEARQAHHDLIDEAITGWTSDRTPGAVVAALWPAGIPVAAALGTHEQPGLPQLVDRGFFESVERPVAGPALCQTWPVRSSAAPTTSHRRPAPLLGEHNREVLREVAGLDDGEIDALEADGVLAASLDPLPAAS